jgi:hypothetical protein
MAERQKTLYACDLTTDLYLEMLRRAQRVEDKKLIRLIYKRISERTMQLDPRNYPTGVIPFPLSYAAIDEPIDFIDDALDNDTIQIAYWWLLSMGAAIFGTLYIFVALINVSS